MPPAEAACTNDSAPNESAATYSEWSGRLALSGGSLEAC